MVRKGPRFSTAPGLATRPRDDANGRGTPGRLRATPIGARRPPNIGHIRRSVQGTGRKKSRRRKFRLTHAPRDGTNAAVHNATETKPVKLVIAVIKPHKLEDVRDALAPLGLSGMTVTEARGYGRQKGQAEIYRGAEYTTNLLPKTKLEIMVDDTQVDQVVEAIQRGAHTGRIGDGKIFVTNLGRAIRIRTGETQTDAL